MEKIDNAIEILQAYKEGKTIEYFNGLEWIKYRTDGSLSVLLIDLGKSSIASFRIAKEPTYRPYTNAEEFLKASKEHGPYVKDKQAEQWSIVEDLSNDGIHLQGICSWSVLYDYYVWQDGTPCGILIKE